VRLISRRSIYYDLDRSLSQGSVPLCRRWLAYLQLDEVCIAMLCDPRYRQGITDRGDDPEQLGEIYGNLINTATSDIPSGMIITMHVYRPSTDPPTWAQAATKRFRNPIQLDQGAWILHGIRRSPFRRL
jgi:methionine synthase II (cobalamin-independent)